jgi:glycine/D-amino acid oxidase-like deaminating enzyme
MGRLIPHECPSDLSGDRIDRRSVLIGAGLLGLSGCAPLRSRTALQALAPVRAEPSRLFDITVCLRPFRAAGPRLDTETIGGTLVVHNYGHGGSGWSLSWGSAEIAVRKALENSPSRIAVLGCGALGLTSAIVAQRAGAQVTIYAADRLPQTRSARATGSYTPDSRIALTSEAAPGFPALWEQMARASFKAYRNYLGLPGAPVEWNDRYILSDTDPDGAARSRPPDPLGFADYHDRIRDIAPRYEPVPEGSTPFPTRYVRRASGMMFNLADYGHTLMTDFLLAGGRIETRTFHSPAELDTLPEKTVINCPGYGGRALWNDNSIVPVRGQIAWLIPQSEVTYGVVYKNVSVLSRTDGIVVQAVEGGDMKGYKNDQETVDQAEADKAVATIAELFGQRFRAQRG